MNLRFIEVYDRDLQIYTRISCFIKKNIEYPVDGATDIKDVVEYPVSLQTQFVLKNDLCGTI